LVESSNGRGWIQLVVALAFGLPFGILFEPTFREHIVADGIQGLLVTSLSCWFFVGSLVLWIDSHNRVLINLLIHALLPINVIVALNLFVWGAYLDFVHLVPAVVTWFIVARRARELDLKLSLSMAPLLLAWAAVVYFRGLNYTAFPLPAALAFIVVMPGATALAIVLARRFAR
jgi:hypothetical protein